MYFHAYLKVPVDCGLWSMEFGFRVCVGCTNNRKNIQKDVIRSGLCVIFLLKAKLYAVHIMPLSKLWRCFEKAYGVLATQARHTTNSCRFWGIVSLLV